MPGNLFQPPFDILEPPAQTLAMVFNSPHSGRIYPQAFIDTSKLDALALRRSEDCFIDEMFQDVTAIGAPLLRANFPRAFLDVNREPYELDPLMFAEPLPDFVNTRSLRVAGGLGTIARLVSEDQEIYQKPLSFKEAAARVNALYEPYHRALEGLVGRTQNHFGQVLLVDCHSMPSADASGQSRRPRPDFVLGDRYGSACAGAVTDFLEDRLRRRGYCVVRNRPYAGGFITQSFGVPERGRHAIQMEINRALYADEARLVKNDGFARMRGEMRDVMAELGRALPRIFAAGTLAAE